MAEAIFFLRVVRIRPNEAARYPVVDAIIDTVTRQTKATCFTPQRSEVTYIPAILPFG